MPRFVVTVVAEFKVLDAGVIPHPTGVEIAQCIEAASSGDAVELAVEESRREFAESRHLSQLAAAGAEWHVQRVERVHHDFEPDPRSSGFLFFTRSDDPGG